MENIRYDRNKISKYEQSGNGTIRLWGTIASVGWLTYMNKDGTIREEYASKECLFDEEFLEGVGGAPLTLGHPPEMVTPANYKKYAVGSTGTKVVADRKRGVIDIVTIVADEAAIRAVADGKMTDLSMGYFAKVTPTGGNTYRQDSRSCNHNAIVAIGRSPKAKLHFDGMDDAWFMTEQAKPRKSIKLVSISV